MSVKTVCTQCGSCRAVRSTGVCYGCAYASGRQRRRDPATPALLTLLCEEAERVGLEDQDVVTVQVETPRGLLEYRAMVCVVGGTAEEDEDGD